MLLTSYVTTLCRNIEHNIHILCAGAQQEFDASVEGRITVSTVHKQALALAKASTPTIHPVDADKIEALIKRHHGHGGYLFDTGFLSHEWTGVIEPQGISTWDEYRDAMRTGRGKPLTIKLILVVTDTNSPRDPKTASDELLITFNRVYLPIITK